jgi:hypothetical protein
VGWGIVMNARIGLKLHITATTGFHSLYDWCFQMMWLFSGVPEDPEDDPVMEKHGTDALYSALKSLMHVIWTEDQDTQQDAANWTIQNAEPWMRRRWSESRFVNGKPHFRIRMKNVHLVDLECNEDEEAKLKILVA